MVIAHEGAQQTQRRRTVLWWVVGSLGVALGVAGAVWFGLAATVGRVSWTDIGYHVVDDRTVDVRYDVHRPSGTAVVCVVRALDQGYGTVGVVEVRIPAGEATAVPRNDRVRTTSRAVTGLVKDCRAA